MAVIAPEVLLPVRRLDLKGALDLCQSLWKLPEADRYLIDFADLEWVEPFGMLYFARQLRAFADKRKSSRFRAINHEGHGYAAHMGFFQSFGLRFGKDPGEALGNTKYLPLTAVTAQELQLEAQDLHVDVREVIEKRCARLSAVLTQEHDGAAQDTLTYSLREIFRNVLEHSCADRVWFAAQCWPEKQLVEVSVLDEGIGLRPSLLRNPHLAIKNDEDALHLAILPGVSGVAFRGSRVKRRDVWANSGYGLYMTSQICARGGSFFIASGGRGLMLSHGQSMQIVDTGFAGTALRMELYLPEIRGLDEALAGLRKRGAEIASELRHGGNLTASMSSRMLAKDFPK